MVEKDFVREDLPNPVPVFQSTLPNTIVFPASSRAIRFTKLTAKDIVLFKKIPYCVLSPLYPEKTDKSHIAIFGHAQFQEDGDFSLLVFTGLQRVTYSISHRQDGYNFASWEALQETPIATDIYEGEKYKKQLGDICVALANLLHRYKEIIPDRFDSLYTNDFVQKAISRLYLTKGANTSDVVDGVMNIACLFGMNEIDKHDFVRKVVLTMLTTEDVYKRFNYLASVLQLFYVSTFPDTNDADMTRMVTDVLTPLVPSDDSNHPRALLQQALMIPPSDALRFPPIVLGAPAGVSIALDLDIKTEFEKRLSVFLDRYLIDQDRCKRHIINLLIGLRTGLFTPKKPVIGGFFCGPTGVGKTLAPEVLAQYFFDDMKGYLRIDGPQFSEKHTISRFTGSPNGYLGFGESTPFSQWGLDKPHVMKLIRDKYKDKPEEYARIMSRIPALEGTLHQTGAGEGKEKARQELQGFGWRPGKHPAIIVVDEMEKMHIDVLKLFIRILDDGRFQMMNGDETLFHNAIFFFTANIYGKDIVKIISQKGYIGFQSPTRSVQDISHAIWKGTIAEIEKTLPPEIFGRIGGKKNVVVFHPFREKDLTEILRSIAFPEFADRVRTLHRIEIIFGESLLQFILEEMASDETSRSLGARALLTLLEHKIEARLGNLLLLGIEGHPSGLHAGDTIYIDVEKVDNAEHIIVQKVM